MQGETLITPVSNKGLWTGRVLSALIVAFLALDAVMKFVKPPPVVEAFAHLGWPISLSIVLGIVLLACTAIYAIPRTSVLGALLLTGYLGGAVATHLRIGDPFVSHALFPIYMGVLVWTGIFLRDDRLRALIPLRN
ncbi:MAG: DoxX family protein [Acidobacteriaceae bacterium]